MEACLCLLEVADPTKEIEKARGSDSERGYPSSWVLKSIFPLSHDSSHSESVQFGTASQAVNMLSIQADLFLIILC